MWMLLGIPIAVVLGLMAVSAHKDIKSTQPQPSPDPTKPDGHGTGVIGPQTTVDGHGTGVLDVNQEAEKAAAQASGGISPEQQALNAAVNTAADEALRLSQNPDGTFVPEADAATLLLSGLPTTNQS